MLQVRTIATDRLRDAFKDVQPQLEKPYTSSVVESSDGRARYEREPDQKLGNLNETFLEK
ncbi:hypothetical protein QFC24_002978 [Naganishia onofrii]|uniref:Uncharacterized protein n=1 Tax=Naganishia onofrii TaxID=1851511 RepID=A0ACC2XNL8_9TREE|nr:hypothetical protein QFC24_002978 [Naganishia onofrii]